MNEVKKNVKKLFSFLGSQKLFNFITLILTFLIAWQQFQINELDMTQTMNPIILSSSLKDSSYPLNETPIDFEITVESNYEGTSPVQLKISNVLLNGKEIHSNYKLRGDDEKIITIKKGDEERFNFSFNTEKEGEYELVILVRHNFPMNTKDFSKGKEEPWRFNFEIK
ncbi:hypothetical protein H6501_04180 [Candidatus Woesearchaeota archaeon]|nr:hypothetical protein [Nanoarchaeota archaeon]MCB9370770.1 hypothetical protein [Candidatus Woesearchaeota archaeon]USN43846.1 MAG: hypothetical protein H6500_05655 [Candidatus Woesearchaeota archaeon]